MPRMDCRFKASRVCMLGLLPARGPFAIIRPLPLVVMLRRRMRRPHCCRALQAWLLLPDCCLHACMDVGTQYPSQCTIRHGAMDRN